jgi:hypothetical protein
MLYLHPRCRHGSLPWSYLAEGNARFRASFASEPTSIHFDTLFVIPTKSQ